VPVGAGRVLWTLDELPGELRSQKTCPPGRQCGPAWVYEDAWSQHSSYSPAATTPLDEPLQRTSPSAIRWCPQGPGRACSAARRAPRGSQMCQLDSQGVPAWVYVGVSILHLHAHQQQQRTDPWTSFNYRRAASAARCGAWIARVYRRGGASIAGRASIACLPSLAGSAFIAGRASIACLPSLAGSSFIAGRACSAAGRDLLAWALGDESHLVQTSSVTGSGLEGEPCYGRGIRELGRSKSASSTMYKSVNSCLYKCVH
jgi:hypothetical protein